MNIIKRKSWSKRTLLHITSAGILLAGIVSAVLIYVTAMNDTSDSTYEVVGGFVYPGGGAYNKKYIHDLQLYGGNAAMLGDQFTRWFFGLWHGTSLAYTVACITIVMAFVFFVAGNNASGRPKSDKATQ